MGLINFFKLLSYPDLAKSGFDRKLLNDYLSNDLFLNDYNSNIKPFLDYLKTYTYIDFSDSKAVSRKLDNDVIMYHLNLVLKTYEDGYYLKYISFVKKDPCLIIDYSIFKDKCFDELYELLGDQITDEKVSSIIKAGCGDKLLFLLKKGVPFENINLDLCNIYETIVTISEIVGEKVSNISVEFVKKIISGNYLEGLIYTYNNIENSRNFIKSYLLGAKILDYISFEEFSMNFIKKIGDTCLSSLYYNSFIFQDKEEFDILFKIASLDNYDLIRDIINFSSGDVFSFKYISEDDMNRDIFDIDYNSWDKRDILLSKYFGVPRGDSDYLRLFLESITQAVLPQQYKEKYADIINFLVTLFKTSEDEVKEIAKNLSLSDKDSNKQLLYNMEREGNEVLKNIFCDDLKNRHDDMVNNVSHVVLDDINVYEFNGEPFTMLVHAITNNEASPNNDLGRQIILNPDKWYNQSGRNNHISTSLISNKYMQTYDNNGLIFGFYNIPSSSLKLTSVTDVGINRDVSVMDDDGYNNKNRSVKIMEINTITTIDNLIDKTIVYQSERSNPAWNEVVLSRTDNTGSPLVPDYIVCMDAIDDISKNAAKYFGIPIYLINKKYYKKQDMELEDNYKDLRRG